MSKALESRIADAIKLGDSDNVVTAKTDKAKLNMMSTKASNMVTEFHAEELCSASDQHINCITLPDRGTLTMIEGIYWLFCDYFQKLFTRKTNLSLAHFNNYLVDFPHFEVTEVAGCDGLITH